MNVSIEFDHEDTIFTNGETVFGNIHIYCPNTSVVSNITATLVGESASALTKKTGLLISRKEKEKHRVSKGAVQENANCDKLTIRLVCA